MRCPACVSFTILAMLAAAPCLADVVAFRVTNPTASSWELWDQTRRLAGRELRFGPTDPVQGGSADGGSPWLLEPGATLVFVATGTGARGGVELGLRPAPGNAIVPDAPASLFMPLISGTLESAFGSSGEVRETNRWRITGRGYFAFDGQQGGGGLPSEHPAPHGVKRLRHDQDREPKGPGVPGDRLLSGKSRRVEEAPRIQGTAPASKAPIALTLENRSTAPWTLVVGEGSLPGATLKPIPGLGTGGQRVAEPVIRRFKSRPERCFHIPAGTQLLFPLPGAGGPKDRDFVARLLDSDGRNPHSTHLEGTLGSPDSIRMVFKRKQSTIPRSAVQCRGKVFCILTETWKTPAPEAPGPPPSPVAPVPDPLASLPDAAPWQDPLTPMTGDSASTASSPAPWRTPTPRIPDHGQELRPSGSPGQLPSPRPASFLPFSAARMALPDAAHTQDPLTPMTGDSASVASSSQPFPNVMGDVTWREALRQDLAHSPMFLGTDEGGLLAQRMDLVLDVHAALTSAGEDLRRDAMGRKRINVVTRLGAAGVPAPRPDGLIFLHLGRHYTVARPAALGDPGQFVTAEGSAYVEITREVAGLENPVPVIPSDGHCLIASLHFLKHGKLPDRGQVSAYRAQVAMDLAPEVLSNLVLEMAEEVVRQAHPVLDNGCFATLGPRVSALLGADPHFMGRYQRAVKAAQEAALKAAQESFWLEDGPAGCEGGMEPTFLTLMVPE